jgi:hypothetical protein
MEKKLVKIKMSAIAMMLVCSLNLLAQQDSLEVLFVNPSPVLIGARQCQKGDFFSHNDTIRWTSQNQTLKAFDNVSGKIKILTADLMRQADKSTFLSYMTGTRRLSTRGQQKCDSILAKQRIFFSITAEKQSFLTTDSITITLIPAQDIYAFVKQYSNLPVEDLADIITDYLSINYPNIDFRDEDIELFVKETVRVYDLSS